MYYIIYNYIIYYIWYIIYDILYIIHDIYIYMIYYIWYTIYIDIRYIYIDIWYIYIYIDIWKQWLQWLPSGGTRRAGKSHPCSLGAPWVLRLMCDFCSKGRGKPAFALSVANDSDPIHREKQAKLSKFLNHLGMGPDVSSSSWCLVGNEGMIHNNYE